MPPEYCAGRNYICSVGYIYKYSDIAKTHQRKVKVISEFYLIGNSVCCSLGVQLDDQAGFGLIKIIFPGS